MRKKYLFKALMVFMTVGLGLSSMNIFAQNYFYVGTGTSTSAAGNITPFYNFYEDGRRQYMITAAELQALGASGNILSVAFDVSAVGAMSFNGFTIKIGQTTATSISTFYGGPMTTVYTTGSHTASVGWNGFTFSTPFNWDGTSSVIIEACFDNSSWTSPSTSVRYTPSGFASNGGYYTDGATGCILTSGLSSTGGNRPNMRLEFTPPFPNDAGLNALINPSFPACVIDSAVSVRLFNSGTAALTSAQIDWSINGVLQPAVTYSNTGGLASFGTDTIALGTVTGGLNDGDIIKAWTSSPNMVPDSNNLNDTLTVQVYSSLAGTYVIDQNGNGDFLSFMDAANAMDNFGICDDVEFEVVSGTYIEQFDLKNYIGMNDSTRVTFRSQANDPDSVVVTYSSTGSADNYVVLLSQAPYFTFEGLTFYNQGTTYAQAVWMWASDDVSFDNCVLQVDPGTSSLRRPLYAYSYLNGSYATSSNFSMTNCKTIGGYYGIYFYNYNSSGSYGNNIVIENNEFTDAYYYGVYVYYNDNLQFNNNHIISNNPSASSFGYGALLGITTNGSISGNYIEGNNNWPRYGLYTTSASGDLTTFLPVTNNRVYLPGSSAYYGIYASNSLFVDYSFNSVYINGIGTSTRGIFATSGSYNKYKNNNIQVTSTGAKAMYISGNAVYQSDYNNLSAPNGFVGYFGGDQTTMADWQNATGFDANSVVVNDVYSDTATLKVCTDSLFGMGEANPLYTMDFQGDLRQTPPCIGADEFLPISQFGFNTNPVLCTGDTLVLSQYYYDTVVWNGIDTSNTLVVTAPGSQSVSVYDACGTGTSNFVVVPQENADVADTNLCEGTTAVLETGISGGTYMWSDGSTDSTLTVSSAQTVYVTVVDAAGCTSTDTAIVTQSTDVVLNDTSFCEGESVALNTNMTGTYAWSDGSTNQILNVTAPGTYSVTVTDQNCISSASATVTEILNVVPSFTDSSSFLTVVFTNTTQNATSYLWDFGDGTTSTDVNPIHVYPWTPADVVEYTVTLTAYNSCGDDEAVNDGVRAGQLVSVSEVGIESMINVYPNPNNGLFTIAVTTTEASEMSVQVVDTKGSLVYNQSYGVVNGEVNRMIQLENAAQGIYFVKVTLNGETAVYRLAVE